MILRASLRMPMAEDNDGSCDSGAGAGAGAEDHDEEEMVAVPIIIHAEAKGRPAQLWPLARWNQGAMCNDAIRELTQLHNTTGQGAC